MNAPIRIVSLILGLLTLVAFVAALGVGLGNFHGPSRGTDRSTHIEAGRCRGCS